MEISTYDQDAWVSRLFYHQMDYEDALELFRLLRKNMKWLLRKLPEEAWRRYVIHHCAFFVAGPVTNNTNETQ